MKIRIDSARMSKLTRGLFLMSPGLAVLAFTVPGQALLTLGVICIAGVGGLVAFVKGVSLIREAVSM